MTKEFDKELEKIFGKKLVSKLKCKDCGTELVLCPVCGEAICPKCIQG